MKIRIWCDSGANAHSKWEETFELSDFNLTEEDLKDMTDEDKEEFFREIAFSKLDWGFEEL